MSEVEQQEKKIKITLIPTPLKILAFIVSFLLLVIVGLMIGYGVVGDGKATEVFNSSTWSHIMEYFQSGK